METEDIGPRGCQIVAPRPHRRGEPVDVLVGNQLVARDLRVMGHVAWASALPPFRVGIEFEQRALSSATRWFEQLLRAHPGMPARGRVPDRIPLHAMVYLAAPPRFLVDFSADEVVILRQIASGVTVDELKLRLRDRWATALRALFSLLARQHVTFARKASVPPRSWGKILADLEASLALEELERRPPTAAAAPRPDLRAGVVWRRPRCAEAQGCFERALIELKAGRVEGAKALLRRALVLAPGDPEIARILEDVAIRSR